MTSEFNELNLHTQLVQAVTDLGYTAPMPVQSAVIPLMLAGQDVLGQAQTGTGKTAAFALPILNNLDLEQRGVQSLILTPTRELAMQVAQAFVDFARGRNVRVLAIYGGQSYQSQISQLKRGVHIVVGTPGRLLDLIQKGLLDLSQVRNLVLDEADEMLSMGFIEDIEAILRETPGERQTALFSATLPAEVRRLAAGYMHDPQSVSIHSQQVTVETTEQRYYLVNEGDKTAALTRLFEMEDISSALIFVRTRAASSVLANELTSRGFPAEVLNGDLAQEARERTLQRFRENKIEVLVATDVAARGLDIEDISHVFNFDLPDDSEIYVHRIGRTGRAGKTGIAISLVTPRQKRLLRQIEAFARIRLERAELPSEADIRLQREEKLVNQVVVWLKRARYRREREIIDTLIQEGYDPLDIAAAALKIARADEKQRPIAPVSAVSEFSVGRAIRERQPHSGREYSRYSQDERPRRPAEVSHEPGMVRLSLNMGRKDGLSPNDIVGAIAAHARIPGSSIGKIHIQDGHALVDVPEELVNQVLVNPRPMHIRKQRVEMQVA